MGNVDYLEFLADVHRRMRPRTYLEVGVSHGTSLALARCRAVGVDPAFSITAELDGDVALVRQPSDAFFAGDPLRLTGGQPFDLAFVDGLHLFEFALRDYISAERCATPGSLIIVDDVLPRSVDEAARDRHTREWTGDVYPLIEVLRRYRPDLVVVPVATDPTGMLLVSGLDPTSTVLADNYQAIMAEFRQPDPQVLPPRMLERSECVRPERILSSALFDLLATDRSPEPTVEQRRAEVLQEVIERFGRAYTPGHLAAGPR